MFINRAFCVEKNSAAPDVQLQGSDKTTGTLVVPYVEFVLTEVLKNALQASGAAAAAAAWFDLDAECVRVLQDVQLCYMEVK